MTRWSDARTVKARPRSARALRIASLAVALSACNSELQVSLDGTGGSGAGVVTTGTGSGAGPDSLPASCNPIRSEGACLLPYPSAVFLDVDPSTKTGFRVALTSDHFPVSKETNAAFDPKRLNDADGFSPASQIIAYFPELIDPASLPPIGDPAKSLEPTSATVVVDMETGQRVAHFSEVDAYAVPELDDRQALIIRPTTRLESGRRYAVAVTDTIKTIDGGRPARPPRFAALMAGDAKRDMAKKQAERMPELLAALDKAGAAKDRLILAWDFVTASDDSQRRRLKPLQERTLAAIGDAGLGFTITKQEDDFSKYGLRRVKGTFKAPKFLSNVDPAKPETELMLDASGEPVADGAFDVPFVVLLPRKAESLGPSEKLRILVVGHGFLGSGERELGRGQAETGYDPEHAMQKLADGQGFALFATDWMGLTDPDRATAIAALSDLNRVNWITDRMTQAMANAVAFARVAPAIAAAPELAVGGAQVVDGSRVDYAGFSLGGVLGGVLLALSPDVERGVLHVGGGQWSALFQRSKNWHGFALAVDSAYPDRVDQQVVLDVLQEYFTPVDPITLAPTLLAGGLTGKPKQVLLQMARHDAAVPNLASEIQARTAGLPLMTPSPVGVFDLEEKAGPLPSALAVWDTKEATIPPDTNLALPLGTENDSHDELRTLPLVQKQIREFIVGGVVDSPCSGPCDPD